MGVEVNKLDRRTRNDDDGSRSSSRLRRDSDSSDEGDEAREVAEDGGFEDGGAGIYLGILNQFTTFPQFIGTFVTGIVLRIVEPRKDEPTPPSEGYNGIGVVLFLAALSALGAAFATTRLKRLL